MLPIMAKAVGYMKPTIDPNIRLYIPFNEGIGSIARDYSQYNNHAALTDVEWSSDGFNGAGKFNGNTSFGDCDNDASLNIIDAITLEARVKGLSFGSANFILCKQHNSAYALSVESSGSSVWFYTAGTTPNNFSKNYTFSTSQWYHIVVIFFEVASGTNKKLYVNGVEINSEAATGDIDTNDIIMAIGKDPTYGYLFDGIIDNASISSIAKTGAQIAADCYEVMCS